MSENKISNGIAKKLAADKWFGCLIAILCIFTVTFLLERVRLQISITTVALSLLMIVLFIATVWGSRPAFLTSVLSMLSFNYFFLQPVRTWNIANPENWIALFSFLAVAITAGQLSGRLKKRAEEAENDRQQIKHLYDELSDAFELASHAEALKQSEKLKTALLDAVTHDIRSPLTSIKASVTMLLDETSEREFVNLDRETRKEMLEVINEETDRLNNFVEGMIDLAKIEAGNFEFKRQWDAVDEIISAAITRAQPRLNGHNIKVKIENELPIIRVDARAVVEVFYTLIDNAAKYSPDGSDIFITATRHKNNSLLFAVEDNGTGIDAGMREKVFEKFFRAIRDGDMTTDQPHRPAGNGVGLSIAKGIVEAHNGTISVTDAVIGSGARFEFILPIGADAA